MSEKPEPDFSLDEMAQEMARMVGEMYKDLGPPVPPDPGLTTREYAKEWGISPGRAREHIRALRDQGLLIEGKRYGRGSDGHWQVFPVYRPRREEDDLAETTQ